MRLAPCLAACAAALCGTASAFDPRSLAPEIDPSSVFYSHVNGRWMAATALPTDRGRIGSFDEQRVLSVQRLARAPPRAPAHGQALQAA